MGQGYNFKCKDCGFSTIASLGIGFLYPNVCDEIFGKMKEGEFGEEIKEAAKKELVTKIVEELKSQFRDSLKKQKDAFESRVKEMMDLKQKSQAEQERVAKEAKDVREQQIAPARKQIAEFFKALVPYFE